MIEKKQILRTINSNACWTCHFWTVNAITQHTGMSRCVRRKKYTSYHDECVQYSEDKSSPKGR